MITDTVAYLDYNSTCPALPEVIDAVLETLDLGGINPSSVHALGREARRRVEEARIKVATLVNAEPSQVVFTMGGTEANNLVLMGCECSRILVSAVEHVAVLRTALTGALRGEVISVSPSGIVDLQALDEMLDSTVGVETLVSIMAANNETGILQPISDVVKIAHKHGAKLHTDAIQVAGKMDIDFVGWGADFVTLSAHKIGGPQGVGAVICRSPNSLNPVLRGGGQEHGLRPGTENVAGIVGFGVAADLSAAKVRTSAHQMLELRDRMEERLLSEVPETKIIGREAPRLPNTSCIVMPGVQNDIQLMALDLAGIAVSAGSACSAGSVETSHVLDAMGVERKDAIAAIRVSTGPKNTHDHTEHFIRAWLDLWMRKCQGFTGDSVKPAAA